MADMIQAKSISVTCCEHGTVTIRFHDASGDIVALAADTDAGEGK